MKKYIDLQKALECFKALTSAVRRRLVINLVNVDSKLCNA